MTTLRAEPIPEGSYEIRIWHGDDVPDDSPIETVLVLRNLGDGDAEVALAHGHLHAEANELIGLKALELGFKRIGFSALRGTHVTRWAKYLYSDEHCDFYTVDLEAAQKRYLRGEGR